MRKIIIVFSLCFLVTLNLRGQTNDSIKIVTSTTYKPNSGKGEFVKVSRQQMMAKPDYDKGYALVGNHEFEKAIKPLKKAIKTDSTGNCGTGINGMAHSELGYAYVRLQDFENALMYLDKATEINKFLPEAYANKSAMLTQQGKNGQALVVLDSLTKYAPEYAMGYVQKGFIHDDEERYELALQNYNTFLDLIKKQNQQQNSRALVEDITKRKRELEKILKN